MERPPFGAGSASSTPFSGSSGAAPKAPSVITGGVGIAADSVGTAVSLSGGSRPLSGFPPAVGAGVGSPSPSASGVAVGSAEMTLSPLSPKMISSAASAVLTMN